MSHPAKSTTHILASLAHSNTQPLFVPSTLLPSLLLGGGLAGKSVPAHGQDAHATVAGDAIDVKRLYVSSS